MIIHVFGKPNVGKSTIALALKNKFAEVDLNSILIDGGDLRLTLNKVLGFSKSDRLENHTRVFDIANYLSQQDQIVILTAINPYQCYRDELYNRLVKPPLLVYLDCPLEELIQRDTKQLYVRALLPSNDLNFLPNFTGISDNFDEPTQYDLKLNTLELNIDQCVEKIVEKLFPKLIIAETPPKSMYVGRWQPFHRGHQWLIQQQLEKEKEILIGIRNMPVSPSNPLNAYQVAYCIKKIFPNDNVVVKIIPDIESFNYGRKVGYEINEYTPEDNIFSISGTNIRENISYNENIDVSLHEILNNWII